MQVVRELYYEKYYVMGRKLSYLIIYLLNKYFLGQVLGLRRVEMKYIYFFILKGYSLVS